MQFWIILLYRKAMLNKQDAHKYLHTSKRDIRDASANKYIYLALSMTYITFYLPLRKMLCQTYIQGLK